MEKCFERLDRKDVVMPLMAMFLVLSGCGSAVNLDVNGVELDEHDDVRINKKQPWEKDKVGEISLSRNGVKLNRHNTREMIIMCAEKAGLEVSDCGDYEDTLVVAGYCYQESFLPDHDKFLTVWQFAEAVATLIHNEFSICSEMPQSYFHLPSGELHSLIEPLECIERREEVRNTCGYDCEDGYVECAARVIHDCNVELVSNLFGEIDKDQSHIGINSLNSLMDQCENSLAVEVMENN